MAMLACSPQVLRRSGRCQVLAHAGQRRLMGTALQDAVAPPLILLLDLDETLIRPKLQRVHRKRTLSHTDFRILIDGNIECQAALRPGLQDFLEWIKERRASGHIAGPWIFGMGARSYIRPIISRLDPSKKIFGNRILARDKCTALMPPWPWFLKSLTQVPCECGTRSGREGNADHACGSCHAANIPRMVLVDNNVMSCILHPENSLLIRDWQADGTDADDSELARVSSTIDAIIAADAADGASGNYAHQLAKMTPGFDEFQRRLAELHARMQEAPDPARPPKDVLIEVWEEACSMKRMLLNLGPNEA